MSAIIPLSGSANLPAYLKNRENFASINADVITGGLGFPVLSIKGKVFALVKDGERKVLTRPDDPDEVLQYVNMTVVRANVKSRVFYAKSYVEGEEGDAAKPDCYTNDGVAPAADARSPQAKKCAVCKHAVWGSKVSVDGREAKGTACTVNSRLAIVDPEQLMQEQVEPYLLRVPAGSRKNFNDVVKAADARGIPYNALVLKVGFDKEAPSPKLTFKLTGLASDAAYEKLQSLFEDETVKSIVGLGPVREGSHDDEPSGTSATDDDIDAALAAKAIADASAAAKKAAEPKKATEPKKAPAPEVSAEEVAAAVKPAKSPAPAPAPAATAADDLLAGLDALLDSSDD